MENMKRPTQKTDIDLTDLRQECKDLIDFYDNYNPENGDEDRQSDYINAVFESTVTAVFGEEVWDFINSKT